MTALAVGFAGTAVGVLLGVVVERLARNLGRLWCEPRETWEPRFHNPTTGGGFDKKPVELPGPPDYATYSFTLDLFNGKEIPVGLRKIKLCFECKGSTLETIPEAPETGRVMAGITRYDPVGVLNLPPRQLVSQEFRGAFRGKDVEILTGWDVVRLVAEYPGGRWFRRRTFSEVIARRQGE